MQDCFYYRFQLASDRQYNGRNNLLPFIVVVVTGGILRSVSPKFGKMVAEEANRKGYYRLSKYHVNFEPAIFAPWPSWL